MWQNVYLICGMARITWQVGRTLIEQQMLTVAIP